MIETVRDRSEERCRNGVKETGRDAEMTRQRQMRFSEMEIERQRQSGRDGEQRVRKRDAEKER